MVISYINTFFAFFYLSNAVVIILLVLELYCANIRFVTAGREQSFKQELFPVEILHLIERFGNNIAILRAF
jgi:hypothetical protein